MAADKEGTLADSEVCSPVPPKGACSYHSPASPYRHRVKIHFQKDNGEYRKIWTAMMKPNKLMLQIQVADLTDLTLSLHDFVLFYFVVMIIPVFGHHGDFLNNTTKG